MAKADINTETVGYCRRQLKKSQERLAGARSKMSQSITEGTGAWKDETFREFASLQADITGNIVAVETAIETMCSKLDELIRKAEGIKF